MTKQLTDPPTEDEVSALTKVLYGADYYHMLTLRLAYDRDRLQTVADQLADAFEKLIDQEDYRPDDAEDWFYDADILAREIIATREAESNEA